MAKHYVVLALPMDTGLGRGVIAGAARYLRDRVDWQTRAIWPLERLASAEDLGGRPDAVLGRLSSDVPELFGGVERPLLVNISRGYGGPEAVHVTCDDKAIGRMAAEYLLGKGLEHFAFYGPSEGSGWRRGTFIQTLAARDRAMHELDTAWKPAKLERALVELPKPCGVLAFNDMQATTLIGRCQELGVNVPEELSVVGVDNDTFATVFSTVSVSSVAVDFEEVGYEAMGVVDRIVKGGERPTEPIRMPPSGVIERHSSDFPGQPDALAVGAMRQIRQLACKPIRLPQMVESLPASYKTVDRRFRKAFGRSMGEEVTRVRMQEASRLLTATHMPFSLIAEEVGYANTAYFSTVFRKRMGMPPGAYRKQYQTTRRRR